MAERGDDSTDHHHVVARGESGEDIADDEQNHEHDECDLAVDAGQSHSDEDGADGDSEGISRDQIAGDGLGDPEIGGHLGQQSHDDELRESDSEPADGESEKCEWHGV